MCYIGNTKYVDSAGTDGGAGGYTQTLLNQTNSGEDIEITIGAGGTAAKQAFRAMILMAVHYMKQRQE